MPRPQRRYKGPLRRLVVDIPEQSYLRLHALAKLERKPVYFFVGSALHQYLFRSATANMWPKEYFEDFVNSQRVTSATTRIA